MDGTDIGAWLKWWYARPTREQEMGEMSKTHSNSWWRGYTDGGLDFQTNRSNPNARPNIDAHHIGEDYEDGFLRGWDDAKHGKDYPFFEQASG